MTSTNDEPAIVDAAPSATLTIRFANPVMKALFATPARRLLGRRLALVRFTGRRTGVRYCFPVGVLAVRGRPIITSRRGWRFNFDGGAPLELRRGGGWERCIGSLVTDEDLNASLWGELIDAVGIDKTKRNLGLRITTGRRPTQAELVDAVHRIGMTVIFLEPDGAA